MHLPAPAAHSIPQLPKITVIIEAKPGERQVNVDGLTFSLQAEDGALPKDVSLNVEKITDEATADQLSEDAILKIDQNNLVTGEHLATARDLLNSYRIGLTTEDGTSYDISSAVGKVSVQVSGIT